MRVIHVITRLIVGGAQENTITSVLGLRQKPGTEVELISGPTCGPEGSLEDRVARIPGLLTIVPEIVRPVHPLKDLIATRKLEDIFHAHKPDIVHTHSSKAGILGRVAAARAGVAVIVHHIHGPSFGPFQGVMANIIFRAAERYAGKVTTHFIVVAEAMKSQYLAAGIGKPEMYTRIFSGFPVMPYVNAVNDPALRVRLGFTSDDFIIGKIARFVPRKGHADLLRALQMLLPQCPRARLLLLGDGVLRSQIEKTVNDLGLVDKVVFAGLVPPGEVPQYVGIMDCLAHLSTFPEGLPRALPQALAAGKPVVSYDFDGADEVCLENETGFIVHTGDITATVSRFLQLASDAALRQRLGGQGQQFVQKHFPEERMVDEQHALYLRLC